MTNDKLIAEERLLTEFFKEKEKLQAKAKLDVCDAHPHLTTPELCAEIDAAKIEAEIKALYNLISKARAEGLPSKSEDEAVNAFFHEPALNEQSKKWNYGILGYEALEQAAINLFRTGRQSALAEINNNRLTKHEYEKAVIELQKELDDLKAEIEAAKKREYNKGYHDACVKITDEHQAQVRKLKEYAKTLRILAEELSERTKAKDDVQYIMSDMLSIANNLEIFPSLKPDVSGEAKEVKE